VATVCPSWLLDSGCSHDMHPGGNDARMIFRGYKRLRYPILVHFGKRGTTAQAVGAGEMEIQGCSGPITLSYVLHVPELDGPLFFVRAALKRGLAIHFCPARQHCGSDDAIVMSHWFWDLGRTESAGRVCRQESDTGLICACAGKKDM
jgi:hypothetical protein